MNFQNYSPMNIIGVQPNERKGKKNLNGLNVTYKPQAKTIVIASRFLHNPKFPNPTRTFC
ncbi:hypothetical protein [Histophilus somni]|uniref:hypothetical protein n=1 Tax=Histophilus somni TaxID=731 RepID=UPI00201ED6BA|nr:hypothetical protein [Histophilus somni]